MLSLIDTFLILLLGHLFWKLFFLSLKILLLRRSLCANFYITHVSLNLFWLKGILSIMFYVNLSCYVILFLFITSWFCKYYVKFTLLCSRIHEVKSPFCPLRVSVLKARTIFTIDTVSPPNVSNIVPRISPTHRLCEAPQYIHTVVVNNPANTSYSRHERISFFLQPGVVFTRPSLTSFSPTFLSSKPFFFVRSPLSNIISCNSCNSQFLAQQNLVCFGYFLM